MTAHATPSIQKNGVLDRRTATHFFTLLLGVRLRAGAMTHKDARNLVEHQGCVLGVSAAAEIESGLG